MLVKLKKGRGAKKSGMGGGRKSRRKVAIIGGEVIMLITLNGLLAHLPSRRLEER